MSWLVSDNRDNLPCRTESTRPVSSCLLTKPDSAFVGIRLCTDVSALQKSGPLSDKEQKYWEIQMFLTGQLSNVPPKCDIKKKERKVILQIKQEKIPIDLFRTC